VTSVHTQAFLIDQHGNSVGVDTEDLDARDERPHERLARVLRNVRTASSVEYGLIKPDALRSTSLVGPFWGSDYVLVAQLAVLGPLWRIPERHMAIRVHDEGTFGMQWSALQAWFDPSAPTSRKPVYPLLRLGKEFVRGIHALPLSTRDRLRCDATALFVWHRREFRNIAGAYKRKIVGLFHPNAPASP
jgi:hypothetical protein